MQTRDSSASTTGTSPGFPRDLEAYAHIEGLVGEENELLESAEEDRKEEHRQRLHAITEELDRAWETLRRRAERRGKSRS